jgi:hypothetical protein
MSWACSLLGRTEVSPRKSVCLQPFFVLGISKQSNAVSVHVWTRMYAHKELSESITCPSAFTRGICCSTRIDDKCSACLPPRLATVMPLTAFRMSHSCNMHFYVCVCVCVRVHVLCMYGCSCSLPSSCNTQGSAKAVCVSYICKINVCICVCMRFMHL